MTDLLPAPSPLWGEAIRHAVRATACRIAAVCDPDAWATWELTAARERHQSEAAMIRALAQDEEAGH